MNLLLVFFRLIRWKNLLIVALTQWMVWYFVIHPMNSWANAIVFLTAFNCMLLSLSTVLIAAAGYIINDYFDVRIDLINKPNDVIIEKIIPRRAAILWHSFLNVIGLLAALYLAWRLHNFFLIFIQIACTVLLWFYSTKFKREFIKGNLIVAFLVAFTVLILAVFEPSLYPCFRFELFIFEAGNKIINPLGVIIVYAYFAFILTWMREIVKDMEDFKGDIEEGCVTMPIKIGLQKSQWFVTFLGVLGILPLVIAAIKLMQGSWSILGIYILLAIIAPILYLLYILPRKTTKLHYQKISKLLKVIMITGVLSLLIYWLLQY